VSSVASTGIAAPTTTSLAIIKRVVKTVDMNVGAQGNLVGDNKDTEV
jgi:hypothetical protein